MPRVRKLSVNCGVLALAALSDITFSCTPAIHRAAVVP